MNELCLINTLFQTSSENITANLIKVKIVNSPLIHDFHFLIKKPIFVQVQIHSFSDYPIFWSPIYLQSDTLVKIMLTPRIISTSEFLRYWTPFTRGCYYPHEKLLKFFKVYTAQNCEIECRANNTLKYCGCATYNDPSKFSFSL